MALTPAGLKAQIESELTAAFGAAADATLQTKLATAISNAVINYLKANAVVSTTSSCTAGGAAATGTIS